MAFVSLDDRRIEYRMIPGRVDRPPIVLLHEGLGSAALWRDFPDRVAERTHARVIAYSRFGYGQSSGLDRPRTAHFMHEEALDVLPRLLDALDAARPVLLGLLRLTLQIRGR